MNITKLTRIRPNRPLPGLALFIASMIFAIGCSKDKVSSPPTEEEQNMLLYETLFTTSPNETVEIVVSDSAVITVSAGLGSTDTLSYNIEGLSNSVICDANLVSAPTDLQMNCERLRFVRGSDSTRAALLYDCQPDGTVFNDSLVIDVDPAYFNNNPNSNIVKLFVYSDLQNQWLHYDNAQKSDPRIVFYLTHFSKYAIAD